MTDGPVSDVLAPVRRACPVCGVTMIANNLSRHCRTMHGKTLLELTGERRPSETRLPVGPILRHLHLRGGDVVGTCLATAGYHKGTAARAGLDKALERAINDGHLTLTAADAICCHVLGLHPCLVYGDAWWVDVPDVPLDQDDAA